MLAHYFTLEALSAELRIELAGATVFEAFTQEKNELIFTLDSPGRNDRSLVIVTAPGMNAAFLREGRMRAKKNSTDIFPEIFGSPLAGVVVEPFSRIMTLTVGEYRVRAHLFNTAAANVFLLRSDDVVISAFRGSTEFAGSPYRAGGRPDSPADPLNTVRLRDALGASAGTLEKAVREIFPWLGALCQREALFRAGIDGGSAAREADPAAAGALSAAISGMLEEIGRPEPSWYAAPGFDREILSVVGLGHLEERRTRSFRTVNEGILETFARLRRESGLEEEKAELLEAAERERRKIERSLKEARARADGESAAERYRAAGSLILTRLNDLRKGMTEATLTDETGAEVRIRLDRALTPAANANAYFDRARKDEKAREENNARVGILRTKLAEIEALIAEISGCEDVREVRGLKKRMQPGRGAPVTIDRGERLPYRIFRIGERHEAWVGKSSSDNDALTFGHAGPHDYWMHVRGASGSHVVLKSPSGGKFDPPKEVLRIAAGIAAYYSKMKKAGMVPVAYCERKYVKKPKNAPPGTVTMQREEIIYAEPHLP